MISGIKGSFPPPSFLVPADAEVQVRATQDAPEQSLANLERDSGSTLSARGISTREVPVNPPPAPQEPEAFVPSRGPLVSRPFGRRAPLLRSLEEGLLGNPLETLSRLFPEAGRVTA